MSDLTFFWHDYETFGNIPRRDRPAQFAGIRTDASLNEIGEPVMWYCRPAPDFLPSPEACLLTGILPQICVEQGVPEVEFARRIEAELAQPGTVGVGYNTLRFDDEVTRHLFWRNLIDPYAREWQNGCGRWDILDMVRCTWALRPEGIEWPSREDGRPSFKLEHLSAANGLLHETAHDALSDVRATIAVARLIRERQPKLFEFCLKLRHKDAVLAEMGVGRPFIHLSGMYGTDRGCMAVVWPLAPHPTNRNEIILWDLAHDPELLFSLRAEEVRQRLYTRSEDLPEGVERLPIKTLHINRSPLVVGNLKMLQNSGARRWPVDMDRIERHAERLARDGAKLAGLWSEVYARPDRDGEPVDVDEDLYGGFIGPDDRRQLQRLKALSPEDLASRCRPHAPAFADGRLEELVFRYRARNFPDTLSGDEQERWTHHRVRRLHKGMGGPTLQAYLEKLDQLMEASGDDERAHEILGALVDYAEHIAPELG